MEWEKIFSNYISDKGFISKKCKELIQLSSRTKQTPSNAITKWTRGQNKHFSKEDIQIANRYMKTCSALLVREV